MYDFELSSRSLIPVHALLVSLVSIAAISTQAAPEPTSTQIDSCGGYLTHSRCGTYGVFSETPFIVCGGAASAREIILKRKGENPLRCKAPVHASGADTRSTLLSWGGSLFKINFIGTNALFESVDEIDVQTLSPSDHLRKSQRQTQFLKNCTPSINSWDREVQIFYEKAQWTDLPDLKVCGGDSSCEDSLSPLIGSMRACRKVFKGQSEQSDGSNQGPAVR